MVGRLRRARVAAAFGSLLLGLTLLSSGSASATAGDLKFIGCIGDLAGCTATAPAGALDGAEQVATSGPNTFLTATNVYVVAATGNALSHFTVDSSGNPSFAGCVGDLAGCTTTTPAGALDNAAGLSISGMNLYVAGGQQVSHFSLDTAGNPTFVGCVGNLSGCTAISNPSALNSGAGNVAVRGKSLYVSNLQGLSYFKLNSAGNPSFKGCFGGASGCTPVTPSNALNGAGAMAFTPGNLYVADSFGSNVSHLTLASDGTPTFVGCIGSTSGCTATSTAGALTVAVGVTVSGSNMYATGSSNQIGGPGAVSQLTLDASGNPSFDLCLGEKTGCTAVTPSAALANAGRVLVVGSDLYVNSMYGVDHLTLDSTGTPTFVSCIGNLTGCKATTPANVLEDATAIAVHGSNLYVTSVMENALSHLKRLKS